MSTQTKTATKLDMLNANIGELPILKHFEQNQIATRVDNFRKGEKGLFWFLKLGFFAAVAWATWTYILPPVFKAIGQMLAVAATGVMIIAGVIFAPVVVKGIRSFARWLHKKFIKYDPFGQLAIERNKMLQNTQTFRISKSKIVQLRDDMEKESERQKLEAEGGQKKIISIQGKAALIKKQMDDIIAEKGIAGKTEDDYVTLANEFQTILAEAQRITQQTVQAKDFVEKYATRALVLKKMNQKLSMVETAMKIKISDFDATVDMLKKDYEFGQKANAATSAAKSALGFTKGWEFDYALEVVTSTIAADIAMTSGNLKDIETLTTNYSMDSDELYSNLELVANKIKVGEDVIPDTTKYKNPDYKMTEGDKRKSGFGELF